MAEDGPLATDSCQHVSCNLARVGALGVVCAVLSGNLHLGTLHCLCNSGDVGERRGNYKAYVFRSLN